MADYEKKVRECLKKTAAGLYATEKTIMISGIVRKLIVIPLSIM